MRQNDERSGVGGGLNSLVSECMVLCGKRK